MNHALVIPEAPGDRVAQGRLALTTALACAQTRMRAGQPVLDGPLAECKERVGGIFILRSVGHEQAQVEVRAMGPCHE